MLLQKIPAGATLPLPDDDERNGGLWHARWQAAGMPGREEAPAAAAGCRACLLLRTYQHDQIIRGSIDRSAARGSDKRLATEINRCGSGCHRGRSRVVRCVCNSCNGVMGAMGDNSSWGQGPPYAHCHDALSRIKAAAYRHAYTTLRSCIHCMRCLCLISSDRPRMLLY